MKSRILFFLALTVLSGIIRPLDAQTPPKDGKKIKYTVKKGDSVNGIARKFGMKPQEVLALNNIKNANHIREGQEILVIDNQRAATDAIPVVAASSAPAAVTKVETKRYHAVMQGETLNSIARLYGTTVANLMQWNNLTTANTGLKPGQKLVVGDLSNEVKQEQFLTGKGRIINERGMGMMISGVDAKLNVALHRSAPEGSMIRIYNESTKRAVLAKVIGKIPNVDSDKKVIVKLSAGACRALGVMNDRFPVEVTYEK
ncbi:LysM peptidoglycan-binding domain-containing protein [Rhodoflexus caldus]|uniref:LysM peptidoglycan-binding domain-containing protein n=1 Tax=Rhodoflexus caldus TaxID=2891236 RepID=UPI00202AB611|nr:LysM peptidoglycan-binding domain-containing protein [Rhodoflexus caldus]